LTKFVDETDAIAAVEGFTSPRLVHDIARKESFTTDDFLLMNNRYKVEVRKAVVVRFFCWLSAKMRNNNHYDRGRHLAPFGVVQQHLTSFDVAASPVSR
jgi:hypothetical protein